MNESERFKIMNSKLSPGVMIYDKLLDKVSVDIATGNKQIDEIMVKTCFMIMHNPEFLNDIMEMVE